MMMNPNTNANGEDLMTLEAEITELQRENARVESQMLRLKSDITAMESHLGNDRVRNIQCSLIIHMNFLFVINTHLKSI